MVHIPQNCWMWFLNKRKKRKDGGNNPNREDCVVICMLQQRGDLIWFRSALAEFQSVAFAQTITGTGNDNYALVKSNR